MYSKALCCMTKKIEEEKQVEPEKGELKARGDRQERERKGDDGEDGGE